MRVHVYEMHIHYDTVYVAACLIWVIKKLVNDNDVWKEFYTKFKTNLNSAASVLIVIVLLSMLLCNPF